MCPAVVEARAVLAPAGKLRVGVFPGSPLSMARDSTTGEMHGLGIDLGKEFANRLGVLFEQVQFQRIAEVLEATKAGDVDFTVSNATPARAVDVNFSRTLISLELGYLDPARSQSGQAQGPPVYCGNISHLFLCASACFQSMPGLE